MSREEAASVYVDNLLGFHPEYALYQEASETLCEEDKGLLQHAVKGWVRGEATAGAGQRFFNG